MTTDLVAKKVFMMPTFKKKVQSKTLKWLGKSFWYIRIFWNDIIQKYKGRDQERLTAI